MKAQAEFIHSIVSALEAADIQYMLAGSVGSTHYGRPRATMDVDLIIACTPDQLEQFISALDKRYYVSAVAAREALASRSMFNIVDSESGWKADIIVRKARPYSLEEFNRKRRADILGQSLWTMSPEDAILSKLEWSKGRESRIQLDDALAVAAAQWRTLDKDYILRWAAILGIEEDARKLLDRAGRIAENRD
jgi:hypothetical protein